MIAAAGQGPPRTRPTNAPRRPGRFAALAGLAAGLGLVAGVAAAAPPARHNRILSEPWFHAPVVDDDCTVCHTMHRDSVGPSLRAPEPGLCYQCHEDLAAKDVVHEPVGQGRCSDCHQAHSSEHRPLLVRRIPELCLACHPIDAAHVARNTLCTSCHTVHSSETSRLLKGERTRACGRCHEPKQRGEAVHPPAREGKCLACHFTHPDPRFGGQKLRLPYEATAAGGRRTFPLCDRCHEVGLHADPAYPRTGFRQGDENLHARHTGSATGVGCSSCHDVHASAGPALLARWLRSPGVAPRALEFEVRPAGGRCGPACHGAAEY
ncbi:MAG: cytochrome c3 family protein, partial [Deferrisomatales bacterium]